MSASSRRRESGVDLAGDELLSDARLARDEDRKVRGRHDRDLGEEGGDGRARPEDGRAARLVGAPLQLARHARPALGPPLERLDERRRPERRARERAERGEEAGVETVEGVRVEGVGRERPDDLPAGRERAAEAGVDPLERVRVGGEEAVEGIGERGVVREEDRCRGAEDRVEARVPVPRVRPLEGRRHEAVRGERDELVPLEPQQARGVEREDPPDGDQQSLVPVERAERRRQVPPDLEEDLEGVRSLRFR